jgi:hypothetical protein
MFYFGPTVNSNVAAERRATSRVKRLTTMTRDSAIAMQQKAKDIAEATARAEAQIAADSERYKRAASLIPPKSTRKMARINNTTNIEAALLEEEVKEAEAAVRLEKRAQKAKAIKELFQKTQKAKKDRRERIRLEKKYDLEHVSYENALAEKRDELLDRGVAEEEAEAQATIWADHYADPKLRVLIDGKMAWGDFALKETPPKVESKPKVKAAVPLVTEASIRVPTMDYRKAAKTAPEFVADYKTLIVLNLPYEPGKKIDRRKLWKSIFGIMTGTEIFGTNRPSQDTVKVSIMIMRPNGTQPRGDVYQSQPSELLKVMAFVVYPTHELAKQALEFSRGYGIRLKDTLLAIQPIYKK